MRLTDGGNRAKGGDQMSLIDKLTGRTKKAAGDLAGDRSLRRQGAKEERKGEKKEERAKEIFAFAHPCDRFDVQRVNGK